MFSTQSLRDTTEKGTPIKTSYWHAVSTIQVVVAICLNFCTANKSTKCAAMKATALAEPCTIASFFFLERQYLKEEKTVPS